MLAQLRSGVASWRGFAAHRLGLPALAIRYLLPIIVLAIGLTVLIVLYLWRDNASYKPIFGSQEKIAASDMMAVLDAEHIPYRIHPQTGQILVPASELGRVRMQLAAKGVVAALPSGLELLDKNDPLGVSQFVQDIRFRRGLEGELVQSIVALEPVAAARVHISLSRLISFVASNNEDKSSASVVVTLKPGRHLSTEQIAAIINLVSGSVSTLSPTRVTLVDQAGNLLSARVDLTEGTAPVAENNASRRYREEVLENIRALLGPVVGADNFKVSVTAEVDNDRIEETREQYGDAPRVTNEASRDEKSSDKVAVGVPGSLSNRAIHVDASMAVPGNPGVSRNALTRQYAYDRSIMQIKHARGELRRLSVAVIINQLAAPSRDGWKSEQLANFDKVLRNGLGINAARGDTLAVTAMNFPRQSEPEPWWMERDTIIDSTSWLLYGITLLLVYLLIARPLLAILRQWLAPARHDPTVDASKEQLDPLQGSTAATVLGKATVPDNNYSARDAVASLLKDYNLPPIGSSVDVLVNHLKELAAKEPERVAEVVKQWVQKYGRKS